MSFAKLIIKSNCVKLENNFTKEISRNYLVSSYFGFREITETLFRDRPMFGHTVWRKVTFLHLTL
jgi:hypothetical protein